ncbi:MAG: hypothetical protein ACOX51_01435 [Myxococcota bacterium]
MSSTKRLSKTTNYRNGKVVEATSSIQNKAQITKILDEKLGA